MPEEGPFGPTIIVTFRLSNLKKRMSYSCLQFLDALSESLYASWFRLFLGNCDAK